jgi:hypothetical protein
MGEMESAPDASLVRRAQAGDSEAFGALVGRYMRAAERAERRRGDSKK